MIGDVYLLQLRKMQEMIAKMQAEMAKQGANSGGEAVPLTANGSTAAPQGTAHH